MKNFFKKPIIWIIFVFLCSAIFRIFFLDLIEFKADEATILFQTVTFYAHPSLIQRGIISGVGVYNLPLFNYLIIVVSLFSRDPKILSFTIALINTFLVVALFQIIKRFYGNPTAILSALLIAFSPWAILFSRKIWAQDLIFILLVPILAILHSIIIKKNSRFTLLLFILLTLLAELHGSGVFFAVATVIIFFILRVHINLKHALLGVIIGFIPAIPYVVFQMFSNPLCVDCVAFLKYQHNGRIFDINSFIRPFQLLNGMGYHFVLGNSYSGFIQTLPAAGYLKYIFAFSAIFPLVGGIYILLKKRNFMFILLYALIIPLLYFVTRIEIYMHYFVILIPIMAILYATGFAFLYAIKKGIIWQVLVSLVFTFFIIANITFLILFYRFISSQKIIEGDYGPILSVTEAFVQNNTNEYKNLPFYGELKSYAYIYPKPQKIHTKLSEFFLDKGFKDSAVKEYNKSRD